MAIPKKKMAGKKPAMKKPTMKKSPMRKAQDGETVERGMTSGIKVRPTFGQNMRQDAIKILDTDSTDYQNTPAKTTAGKILRGANKAASMYIRDILSPVGMVASLGGNAIKAVSNAIKAKKEVNAIKKNGGKISKKMSAPKIMIKKTTSKKKK